MAAASSRGTPKIGLRPVTPEDEAFLRRVYAGTRDDITASALADGEKHALMEMQFTAQRTDYETRFPDAEHSIVLVGGEPWGRIWIDRRHEEIRLLDIAILPERRNQGVGRYLVQRLTDEAAATGTALRHSVYKENTAALRFYRRLGFAVVEDLGIYVLMEWRDDRETFSPAG